MSDNSEYTDWLRRITESNAEWTDLHETLKSSPHTRAGDRAFLKAHREWRKRRDVIVRGWHAWRKENPPDA